MRTRDDPIADIIAETKEQLRKLADRPVRRRTIRDDYSDAVAHLIADLDQVPDHEAVVTVSTIKNGQETVHYSTDPRKMTDAERRLVAAKATVRAIRSGWSPK